MSKGPHLSEFEMLLLLALQRLGDDAYGVTARREIEDRTGKTVSVGAVYTALDRMQRRGYVSSFAGASTPKRGGRAKRHYRVEAPGQRALERTFAALSAMADGLPIRERLT